MNRGCLIYAHNSTIDYGSQAVLAARLAIKHLGVPVSLVTDKDTLADLELKFSTLPFDKIIQVETPSSQNQRTLNNETVPFINGNRSTAWDVTPYHRTLVIDSDFLIFSQELNKYWDADYELLICQGMNSPGITNDNVVSKYSIPLLWATNIMFTKTSETKILFDLVDYIRQEYIYFSGIYEFNNSQFRNDFAFSIACHIMSAHGVDQWHGLLPSPLFFTDYDKIVDINQDRVVMLYHVGNIDYLVKSSGQDLHLMNKRDILANLDQLMELAQ